jgi:hypothetical protein
MLPKSSFADLLKMTPEQRTAFAAGCAERVYDLYERHAKPYRDEVWEAITLSWQRAAGKKVPDDVAKRLVTALDEESGNYANVDDQTLEMPFEVIVAASRALETAHSGDPEKAEAAANFALGAVGRTENGPRDDGVEEELAWQLDWLRFCGLADPATAHAELKRRTATEPEWFVRWTS